MFRVTLIVVAIAALFAMTACGSSAPNELKLTKPDSGKTFDLAKGGTLEVTLEGNPTTGYLWGLLAGNDAVLKPASDYTFKADNPNLVGAGGKFTFKFQAVGVGSAPLKFGYQRPWEQVPPAETFAVTINVK